MEDTLRKVTFCFAAPKEELEMIAGRLQNVAIRDGDKTIGHITQVSVLPWGIPTKYKLVAEISEWAPFTPPKSIISRIRNHFLLCRQWKRKWFA